MRKKPHGHVDPLPKELTDPVEAKIDRVDVSKLSDGQRIARLEGLVELLAEHQVTLGKGLIDLHQEISQRPPDYQPASIILPGPHPLRPPRRE